VPDSPEPPAYFPEDEPLLSARLDSFLQSLAVSLQQNPTLASGITALLLAGGYGRGEGGIFRKDEFSPAELYNDLEFYLITHPDTSFSPLQDWCREQAHRGDHELGIEVEFKILRSTQLQSGQPSMFYYDLLAAHRLVWGESSFLSSLPQSLRDPARIPAAEATRLLFNRGSGLFYSRVALEENSTLVENGFVERNHAKARLALADSVLALNGQYHFSCRERELRLTRPLTHLPPDWSTLVDWHRQGVVFKLHPRHAHPPREVLMQHQEEISAVWRRTFLWLESVRLGCSLANTAGYVGHPGRLFPETFWWKNPALTLRDQLKRKSHLPVFFDYPRAPLQRALLLLLDPQHGFQEAAPLLALPADSSLARIHDRYRFWWGHYN